jgi:hypothetical protein
MSTQKTDYLVVGAGATALSFVDSLLDVTDAHITMVDRRDKAGGHWNDAYPFVRLHQPSSYYGVDSTPLGRARLDTDGLNAGFEELASGVEVASYFHAVMQDRLLASGRVSFVPMTEHLGDGTLRNVLNGTHTQVEAGRIVDASMCENGIPLTHKRQFTVADGVACIAPNFLPQHAAKHQHFTILGAGKTAMDTAVWLLSHGASGDQIRWVRPRDPWIVNRSYSQPSGAFYKHIVRATALQMASARDAVDISEFALGMEASGLWMRLDPDVQPQIMHGPTLSTAELALLQGIKDVVREGHVSALEPERMVLKNGECTAPKDTLYIDCTARALGHSNTWPIFTPERIGLQMIRLYQPMFSAALLARIEALGGDDAAKNALCAPVPMTDDVQSWIKSQTITSMNQFKWGQVPALKNWIQNTRLDGFGRPSREVDRTDPENIALFNEVKALSMPAFANMQKLANL